MPEPPLVHNGHDPRVSLRVVLLCLMAVGQIAQSWQTWSLALTSAEMSSSMVKSFAQRHVEHTALEVQHQKQLEAFQELTWMLSRPQGERPRLEVPASLWGKLNQADRDALQREMTNEPLHRVPPKRDPTRG